MVWWVDGDFNITTFTKERSRLGRLIVGMGRFSKVIENLELRDM